MTYTIEFKIKKTYLQRKNVVGDYDVDKYQDLTKFQQQGNLENVLKRKKIQMENFFKKQQKIQFPKINPVNEDLQNLDYDHRNYQFFNKNMVKTKDFDNVKKDFLQDNRLNQKNIVYIKNGKNIDINQNLSNINIKRNKNLKNVEINQNQENKYDIQNLREKIDENIRKFNIEDENKNDETFEDLVEIKNEKQNEEEVDYNKNIKLEKVDLKENDNNDVFNFMNNSKYDESQNYVLIDGKEVPISDEQYNKLINFQVNDIFNPKEYIQEEKQDQVEQDQVEQEQAEQEQIEQEKVDQEQFDQEQVDHEQVDQEQVQKEDKIDRNNIRHIPIQIPIFRKADYKKMPAQLPKAIQRSRNYNILAQNKKNSDNYDIKVNSYIKNGNLNIHMNKIKSKINQVVKPELENEYKITKINDQKNNNENESDFFVKDKNNFNLNIVQNGLKIIKSLELVDGKMKEVEILVDQSGKRINKDFSETECEHEKDKKIKELDVVPIQQIPTMEDQREMFNQLEAKKKKEIFKQFDEENWLRRNKKLIKLQKKNLLMNKMNFNLPMGYTDHGFIKPGWKVKSGFRFIGNEKVPDDKLIDENGVEVPLNTLNQKYRQQKEVFVGSGKA